jgi:hypothetical protein
MRLNNLMVNYNEGCFFVKAGLCTTEKSKAAA